MGYSTRKTLLLTLALSIVSIATFGLSACGPISTVVSLPSPTPLRTLAVVTLTVEPTETSMATAVPTGVATETPAPTAALTATPTKRGNLVATQPGTTPAASQGVFVSAIKIDPAKAKSNAAPQFTVTFVNTTGKPQMYRWFVKIYVLDQPQSFGETSKTASTIGPKTSQVKAFSDWKTTTFFDCLFVIARVFWVDENNQVHEFLKSNGTNPATGFYVCP